MNDEQQWQQKTMEKLLFDSIVEQRRKRRWGIFFKSLFFAYIVIVLLLIVKPEPGDISVKAHKPHVALIKVDGTIMPNSETSASRIDKALKKAFREPNALAIILDINSPGGSPVQSDDIFQKIMQLRKQHPDKPVYAVCEDICASGAYYIAAASNEIYANPASLVGSIGVLMNGFGFVDVMKKVGVERRLLTAGANKGFLDPFSPMNPQQTAYAQKLLDIVHQQFIARVKQGRGDRLQNDPQLFSGLVWTGQQATKLGLIDGYGNTDSVAVKKVHTTNIVNYTPQLGYFERLASGMGTNFSKSIAATFGLDSGSLR